MMELLAPAGSPEAVVAAVQNGADAIYLGAGDFNARRNAKNFTFDQLKEAVSYCHARGVAVHLTLNTLVTDRQCPQLVDTIAQASQAGVDAFIVQDWGVLEICQQLAPHIACHGSTQMSVHSLDGVVMAAKLGCSRVVLARELSREDYLEICSKSPIEIEVFGHGALCMCHSGQCYFSAIVGRRSGNRGQCAQPCRLPYGYGQFSQLFPLSLKDSCLIEVVSDLKSMGVSSLKLEGRMKRPEYVAIVTRIYRKALDGVEVTDEDLQLLQSIFSREGFTKGYYDHNLGKHMFGTRQAEGDNEALLKQARATYEGVEKPRFGLGFAVEIRSNLPVKLTVSSPRFGTVTVFGDVPQVARNRCLSCEDVEKRLGKLGGTPFYLDTISVDLDPDLMVSASGLNSLRRMALEQLNPISSTVLSHILPNLSSTIPVFGQEKSPGITISVTSGEQITPYLLSKRPEILYVPLHIIDGALVDKVGNFSQICAILPRVILPVERCGIVRQLEKILALGVTHVLGGNIGILELCPGFTVHGDFGLNLFNSRGAHQLKSMGFASGTVSFELLLPQIRDLSKPFPIEMLVYGRLPLMITENCLISWKNDQCYCGQTEQLVERKGEKFP